MYTKRIWQEISRLCFNVRLTKGLFEYYNGYSCPFRASDYPQLSKLLIFIDYLKIECLRAKLIKSIVYLAASQYVGNRMPLGGMAVLETLPAYYTYLKDGDFSEYMPDDFSGDLKKFGMSLKKKHLKDIMDQDILSWISFLEIPSPKEEGLSSKTVSRKLSALSNYFSWLISSDVIKEKDNSMLNITNTRISSPLPEILFEEECGKLLTTASSDPRTYLIFLLLLETSLKLEELFLLETDGTLPCLPSMRAVLFAKARVIALLPGSPMLTVPLPFPTSIPYSGYSSITATAADSKTQH